MHNDATQARLLLNARREHVLDYIKPKNLNIFQRSKSFVSKPNVVAYKDESIVGGSTNVAAEKLLLGEKIGILIAGNHGRPGGKCGNINAQGKGYVQPHDLHPNHTTQEEDIVSNWILTECEQVCALATREQQRLITPVQRRDWYNRLYGYSIGNEDKRWGMSYPNLCEPDNLYTWDTKQVRSYHRVSTTAEKYGFAWHLSNCFVSKKRRVNGQKYFDVGSPVPCSLVFVAGPNAKHSELKYARPNDSNYHATCSRTYDEKASREYEYFKKGVENALAAGLTAMAKNEDKIAVLCHISGGLYAGNHANLYDHDCFLGIANLVLKNYTYKDRPLGEHFVQVVYAPYKDPT